MQLLAKLNVTQLVTVTKKNARTPACKQKADILNTKYDDAN